MRPSLLALAFALAANAFAQQPDAASIMARVAANQDRSEVERVHFLYLQHARVISRKGKTIQCEEITDTRITPSQAGSAQQLLKLDGRMLVKKKYIAYDQLPPSHSGNDVKTDKDDLNISINTDEPMDRDLVENFRSHLTNDRSRDGIGAGLFPLTTRNQADYHYHLVGSEHLNGREVFHLTFEPKDKADFGWKGDAYIDTTAYEPVVVRTTMARKIPFAVRTLLGTSLPGLGFTVVYAPQPASQTAPLPPEAIWFPISFGTEFKLKILFFFTRQITLSAQNTDFEKTHVSSKILPLTPSEPSDDRY